MARVRGARALLLGPFGGRVSRQTGLSVLSRHFVYKLLNIPPPRQEQTQPIVQLACLAGSSPSPVLFATPHICRPRGPRARARHSLHRYRGHVHARVRIRPYACSCACTASLLPAVARSPLAIMNNQAMLIAPCASVHCTGSIELIRVTARRFGAGPGRTVSLPWHSNRHRCQLRGRQTPWRCYIYGQGVCVYIYT